MKKLIFSTVILCPILTVYSSLSYAVLLDRVIAKVNNEVITWSELRRNIEIDGRELLQGLANDEREKKIKELEKKFLDSMIDLKLQIQEARHVNLKVSSSETEGAIADIKRKFSLTDEDLIKSLKAEGLTLDEYREKLTEQILLSKIVRQEVKENILISDKEIAEYYRTHKEEYGRGEKVRIRQIFFASPEDNAKKAIIEAKAREIIQRLEQGEDFAKLAGKFSEDASKEFGGDLGYVTRRSVLKEIGDVAFALEVGEVGRPFWSIAGLHIVKLEDIIAAVGNDEIRNKIKGILFEEAFKSEYEEWVKTLREKAYIEINL